MIGVFSFFSGAGFLDLGFEMTNHFKTLFVNESKLAFNRIYQYSRQQMGIAPPMYGHHVGDISEWLTNPELNADLHRMIAEARNNAEIGMIAFIGGPPCPDFSVAGKNRGRDGDNGKLSQTYVDLICNVRPDIFVFENVKGLYRTARHRTFFEELKQQLVNSGYVLTEQLINAIEFGAPQDRERIILIGIQRHIAEERGLEIMDNKLTGFDWDRHKLYNKEVLDLPWPTTSPYVEGGESVAPEGIINELTIQYWWNRNDVEHHPDANMYFRPKAGLIRFQTKDEGNDLKKCYKRLHRWRYSPTAAYGNNEVHIHPYYPRRISVSEALAIQSLPPNYVIPQDVTLSDAFKAIGNGVPYLLAYGVAMDIYDFINV